MATNDPSLIESITCGICEDRVKHPKMSGECRHTYCKKCLQDWISHQRPGGTFTCPYCRAVYNIPDNGADGLPDNENAKAFIEETEQSKGSQDEHLKLCDPCKFQHNSTKASHYCGGCDGLYFCNACYDLHRLSTKTSRHEIVEICQTHSKVLKHYCVDCHKFTCMLCVLFEHSTEEHRLKPYKEFLASAGEEKRETSKKAKSVLSALGDEKVLIERVNDVMEKKRELWFRSVRNKVSEKLLEIDRTIERLKQERKECKEKGEDDLQTILRCCKITKDTKAAITQLESSFLDVVKKGETLETDRSEAYVTLEDEFLKPARNIMEEAGEKEHFLRCKEMVNKIQDTLQKSVHRDVELKAAFLGEPSVVERLEDEHRTLLRNLEGAISSPVLKNIKKHLAKYTKDKTSDINDVKTLWNFMQK